MTFFEYAHDSHPYVATAKVVALAMRSLRLLQIAWLFQIVVIFSIVLLAVHILRLTSGMQLTSVLIRDPRYKILHLFQLFPIENELMVICPVRVHYHDLGLPCVQQQPFLFAQMLYASQKFHEVFHYSHTCRFICVPQVINLFATDRGSSTVVLCGLPHYVF